MINITNLQVKYPDGTTPLEHVTFALNAGENVALLGGNGAGKTSLLLAMVGLLPISGGAIELDGLPLDKRSAQTFRQTVGLVFQNPDDQLFMPTIREDLEFGPRNFGLSAADAKARAEHVAEHFRITHLLERSPMKLSGGEKRLAAMAAVLSGQPQFLLFDEPTAFLDLRARKNLRELLGTLSQGKLIATHDLSFASAVCGRVLLLRDGTVEEWGIDALPQLERILEDGTENECE